MDLTQLVTDLSEFVEIKEDKETELAEYLGGKLMTPEGVKRFVETALNQPVTAPEKQLLQPLFDRYHNKGLEAWQNNHLEGIIEEEVAKRNPGETPEMKRIRRLEDMLSAAEAKEKRLTLERYAEKMAAESNLPTELVSFFVGQDEESTGTNLERFKGVFDDHVGRQVKARFKDGGRDIHSSSRGISATDIDKLKAQYAEAEAKGMKLQDKIKLSRQIQQLEQQRE